MLDPIHSRTDFDIALITSAAPLSACPVGLVRQPHASPTGLRAAIRLLQVDEMLRNAGGVWSPGIDAFGFIGGSQVGCNWQWTPSFVWGGEADIQYTGLNGSRDVFAPSASVHQDFRSRWLATFRGRFGWLVAPNMNFYATGGLAVCQCQHCSTVNFNGTTDNVSDSTTHAGWTLGAGLEWMFVPQWSAKVEYLYVDLGHVSNALPISNNPSLTKNIFRIGINYHF